MTSGQSREARSLGAVAGPPLTLPKAMGNQRQPSAQGTVMQHSNEARGCATGVWWDIDEPIVVNHLAPISASLTKSPAALPQHRRL